MKKTLDSNAIKLVAIAAMTVDHVAWWLFPGYPRAVLPLAMHIIGRLTCPIMCYFVAEGYHHTRDIRKYTAIRSPAKFKLELKVNLAFRL